MAQQTAVDWLHYKWSNCKEWKWEEIEQWFEQAKAIEKEQIKTAFFEGTCDWRKPYLENMQKAEKYYNVTYKP